MAALIQFFKDAVSPPECGFSNATDYDVKFKLHKDRKLIKKSEREYSGKVEASQGGGVEGKYASKDEAEYSLVDPQFEGFAEVAAGTRLDLKDDPCSGSDAYMTVALIQSGKLKLHVSNYPVNGSSCNYMLGENIHGKLEFVKLHRNRTWRAHGTNGTQNYYGGRRCHGCNQERACERNCPDLAEFGGHKK